MDECKKIAFQTRQTNVHFNQNPKGLLLHVGADTTNLRVVGPRFPDGTFEFIWIGPEYECKSFITFDKLPSRNQRYGNTLKGFLPSDVAYLSAHLDPNFNEYTYAEPNNSEPKQKALKKLNEGDILFFVSSLAPYNTSVYQKRDTKLRRYQRGRKNKYVTAFFTVEGIAIVCVIHGRIDMEILTGNIPENAVRNNQHYRRLPFVDGKGKVHDFDEFVIVRGNPDRSALLAVAVPLTDGQTRYTFRLNKLGMTIRNRSTDNFRGFRPLETRDVQILAREIARSNPKLEQKISHT